MATGQEDAYSYDLTALVNCEPQMLQTVPPTVGVGGGRLHTPPPPTAPGIGVGTNNTSPSQTNVTVGVGGARVLRQHVHPHPQVKDTLMMDPWWDIRDQKGSSRLKELRRVQKNLDVSHVKAHCLPPVTPEVEDEAVQVEAATAVVVVEEEVVEEAEEVVAVEEVEEVVEAMTTMMMMVHLLSDQVHPIAAGQDGGFLTIKKWNSN